jgi:hypothetical protein
METIRSHVNPHLLWRFCRRPYLKLEFKVQLQHPRRLCRNSLAEKRRTYDPDVDPVIGVIQGR